MRETPLVQISIDTPSRDVETRAQDALVVAQSVKILTVADYESAAAQLKLVKSKWSEVDAMRKALKYPIDEAAKRIQLFFAAPLKFLTDAEAIIKSKMVAFTDEQERVRRAEQAKQDERARKERERLAARAEKAAASGKHERAAELEQRAETVVAPIIATDTPKIAGQSIRETWSFEIVDESLIPREYLSPDEKKLRKVVQALRGAANISGVRVYVEKRLASGT